MSVPDLPMGANGKPMALVGMQLAEKIGLPNYSNVDVGPAVVYRFTEDNEEARREGLLECAADCEFILAHEREPVLQLVNGE